MSIPKEWKALYETRAEGLRLVQQARAATGPAVEQYREAAEVWFWEHAHELLTAPVIPCEPPQSPHAIGEKQEEPK